MPIPQFLDHCHVNFSYTLSFTPGYSILLSQDHLLHHSKIPEINVHSRLLHADTKIPGSLPSQLFLYIILHPRLFDVSVTNHTLHQSNIPELDVHSRLLHANTTIPGSLLSQLLLYIILHTRLFDASVTRSYITPV